MIVDSRLALAPPSHWRICKKLTFKVGRVVGSREGERVGWRDQRWETEDIKLVSSERACS